MPAITLDPSQATLEPFADLLPPSPNQQELVGGLNGEQAFQRDQAGNVTPVPHAIPTEVQTPDYFADLIPPPARLPAVAFSGADHTPFADLIPDPIFRGVGSSGSWDDGAIPSTVNPFSREAIDYVKSNSGNGPLVTPDQASLLLGQVPIGKALHGLGWDKAGQIVEGLQQGAAETLSSFTTPENLALMVATGGTGPTAIKLLSTAFAGQAAYEAPARWRAFNATNDPREKAKIATELLASFGLPLLGFLHSGKKPPPTNGGPGALQIGSATTEVPRTASGGETVSKDGGGIRPSEPGPEATGAQLQEAQAATATSPEVNDWTTATAEEPIAPEDSALATGPAETRTAAPTETVPTEADKVGSNVVQPTQETPPAASGILEPRGSQPEGLTKMPDSADTGLQGPRLEESAAERIKNAGIDENLSGVDHEAKAAEAAAKVEAEKQKQADIAASHEDLFAPKKKKGGKKGKTDTLEEGDWFDPNNPPLDKPELLGEWEHRARKLMESEQMAEYTDWQGTQGDELMDAIRKHGGFPLPSSKHGHYLRGEFQRIREHWPTQRTFSMGMEGFKFGDFFRKKALHPDDLVHILRSEGFEFDTPGDLIDAVDARLLSGKKVYGNAFDPDGLKLRERLDEGGATTLIPDLIDFGAKIYHKGMDFGKWAGRMILHLGSKVAEHLKTIWDAVKSKGDERGGIGGKAGQAFGLNIKGKRTTLFDATTNWEAKRQVSGAEARRAHDAIYKVAPRRVTQEGMSIWAEAGGDDRVIQGWLAAPKNQKWFVKAATEALKLTPEQKAMAQQARNTFDILERRGNRYDILKGHVENYVTHVWDTGKKFTGFGSAALKSRFKFNKARSLENFFEGSQAGMKPRNLAIGDLLPAYIEEMNRTIADRQFIQETAHGLSSEGTPLQIPKGNAKQVEATEYVVSPVKKFQPSVYDTMADAQAALQPGQIITPRRASTTYVNPRGFASPMDAHGKPILFDQSGYEVMQNQPALSNWRFLKKDAAGNTTIMKSDIAVHPELARRIHSMMGQSAIRKFYNKDVSDLSVIPRAIAKNLDVAQSTMKREMFGLIALFHPVQEGTHAIGHWVNPLPFKMEDMNRPTPEHQQMMRDGLMLGPMSGSNLYLEGVGAKKSWVSQFSRKYGSEVGRKAADIVDGYQNWLFHQYIPNLKAETFRHALKRNLSRYAEDLASGKVTEGDVRALTAEQVNAAYGHLNYALLDRGPTAQHIVQLALLAPDFLEARAKFAGQAVRGIVSKSGREQMIAVARLAAIQAGSAWAISQALGADWDPKHPFEVTYNGRTYTFRSVPEDMMRAAFSGFDQSREFWSARMNPVLDKAIQAKTGRNYRGEKTSILDTAGEALANYIPIVARSLPGIRDLTETGRNDPISPYERFLGSMGIKISRYSPINKTYSAARDWKLTQGLPVDTGVYPVSKYQQMRYALEDGDMEKAQAEFEKLRDKGGMTYAQIKKGFKQSIEHPFTGTKANDKSFRDSLDEEGQQNYDMAVERRRDILRKFSFVDR